MYHTDWRYAVYVRVPVTQTKSSSRTVERHLYLFLGRWHPLLYLSKHFSPTRATISLLNACTLLEIFTATSAQSVSISMSRPSLVFYHITKFSHNLQPPGHLVRELFPHHSQRRGAWSVLSLNSRPYKYGRKSFIPLTTASNSLWVTQ